MRAAGLSAVRAPARTAAVALRAAISTGSHTGENGGAYPRSRAVIASTVIPAVSATAAMSTRFPAPSRPTICTPSSRPVRRSASIFTVIGAAPG